MVLTKKTRVKTDPRFARNFQLFYGLNFENVEEH